MSDDIREKAEKDYILGMKYKEIAEKYDVTMNTVKSWKTRYKWVRNNAHKKEKVHTKETMHTKKSVRTQTKKGAAKEKGAVAKEVKEVIANKNLTDKQRLFCVYYIKCFNATKAYQKAYECGYETAMVNGHHLLRNPKVEEEIHSLKQHKLNRVMINEDDIFQKYLDIAFSDMGDYMSFKRERKNCWKTKNGKDIPVIDPDTGQQKYIEYNVVELRDSKTLDTTLLSEVSEGKDGVKIKLQDKMKAMQWLSDRMDLLPRAISEKLDIEKQKLELEKRRANDGSENVEKVVIIDDI